jgi:hypothetical protein
MDRADFDKKKAIIKCSNPERRDPMIEQLRKIYSSLLVYNETYGSLDPNYRWFATADNEVIGIRQDELTGKDTAILNTFLAPYNTKFPVLTDEEQQWKNAIHGTEADSSSAFQPERPYRFIYFSINKNQITPVFFHDALQELFAKPVPILWENEYAGVIIEEQDPGEDNPSYEEMVDILMSDLYVKINFFVGPFKEGLESITHYYQSVISTAKTLFAHSDKTVSTYIEAVPYLLLGQTTPDFRQELSGNVLQDFVRDEETLNMLETFFHSNLNISETAKELHMHRNSLQYRLDRFAEKTGIDVRQFRQALTVYLAMLAKR